jgi:hypothetical protein
MLNEVENLKLYYFQAFFWMLIFLSDLFQKFRLVIFFSQNNFSIFSPYDFDHLPNSIFSLSFQQKSKSVWEKGSLRFPKLAERLAEEESDDNEEHDGLGDEAESALVELRGVDPAVGTTRLLHLALLVQLFVKKSKVNFNFNFCFGTYEFAGGRGGGVGAGRRLLLAARVLVGQADGHHWRLVLENETAPHLSTQQIGFIQI